MNFPEDKPLSDALNHWKISARTPPRFGESVWRRIAVAEAEAPPAGKFGELWKAWLTSIFAKPALAAIYVMVLLAAGLTAGYLRGEAHQARANDQLAARYVQSIDPYQPNSPMK